MVTVGDCLGLRELQTVTIAAGREGLTRPVRLTHAVDEPDVLSWVAPEIIVLTTGQNHPEDPEVWLRLIRELDAQGVSALMVSPGRYLSRLPSLALKEAECIGFPVLMVPWELPFVKITEAIHRLLLENHIANWSRVAELEVRVTEAAVQAKTLDELLHTFSALVGYQVTLEFEPSQVSEPCSRFPLPSPDLLGWTLVVGAAEMTEPEAIVARQMAGTLAIWVLQQKISAHSEFEVQATLFDRLLAGQWEDSIAARDRLRMIGVQANRPCRLLLMTLPDPLAHSDQARMFDDSRLLVTQLLHSSVMLSTTHPLGLLCLINESKADVRGSLGSALLPFFIRFPQSVGVLSPSTVLGDLPTLQKTMARMVPLLSPGLVHDMSDALFPAVILNLPDDLMQGLVSTTWERLTDATLVRTLRMLVMTGGHRSGAAVRLGIHRNTMTRRVQQIEHQLGRDLTPALLTQLDLADQWKKAKDVPAEIPTRDPWPA